MRPSISCTTFPGTARVAQNYIGIGVLGVEIRDDFRIILVAEPRVIVDEAVAVNNGFNG